MNASEPDYGILSVDRPAQNDLRRRNVMLRLKHSALPLVALVISLVMVAAAAVAPLTAIASNGGVGGP